MQNARRLFFSFEGRISRSHWWAAFLLISFIDISYFWITDPNYDNRPAASLHTTIANLVLLIPMIAVIVKRCNDRNWPWWLGYVLHAPLLAFIIGDYFGYFAVEQMTFVQTGILIGFLGALIFVIVDNGFLRGTVGVNRYGPDPLEPSTTSPPQS